MFKLNNLGDVILSMAALIQPLLSVIQLILPIAGIMNVETAAQFRIISSAFFILIAFIWIIRRNLKITLLLYVSIILIFFISIIQNPLHEQYIIDEGFKFTLATCTPVFLAYISINEKDNFIKVLNVICYLLFIAGTIYTAFRLTGFYYVDDIYSMSYGYTLLLPAIYFMYKGTLKDIIISILIAFMILLYGSRGPLVVFACYILWKLVDAKKWYYSIGFLVPIISIVIYSQEIISLLYEWGFESRTLNLLNDLSFISHDSGRISLYNKAYDFIDNSPIFGYGVFSDRFLLKTVYVHNLFLEIVLDYGIILSFALFLFWIIWFVYKYNKSNAIERELIIIFLLTSIIPLLYSGSYLTSFMLPLFLGVLYSSGKNEFGNKD